MLIRDEVLAGIRSGVVDRVFRRWSVPRVKVGSRMRTSVGVLEVITIDEINADSVTDDDARAAGLGGRQQLLESLAWGEGAVYRVDLRYVGPDPRLALRGQIPDSEEIDRIRQSLDRFDIASRRGAWTAKTLAVISEHPARRAGDLAEMLGMEKQPFKIDVRKLKELGLTESLEIGYRLSPRGQAVHDHLRRGA
jgi:hypothetical protein